MSEENIPEYPSRSYQHQAGYRTVPWDDWVGMRERAVRLTAELSASKAELEKCQQEVERLTALQHFRSEQHDRNMIDEATVQKTLKKKAKAAEALAAGYKVDAERYRWLRHSFCKTDPADDPKLGGILGTTAEQLDSAIDAAIDASRVAHEDT